jgi:hypothetical protein
MGQVVTFYSYKGGVGRTMALANVAVLLARWGYKTLIVDWDLEAPGLEYFFKDYLDAGAAAGREGIVDLLHSVSGEGGSSPKTLDWQNLLVSIQIPECRQPLHLLTAGRRGEGYFGKVRGFDVETFYAEKGGGLFIESLRDGWKRTYDFVLLDSRTGVTDIGGICTIQLPDFLVVLFTATKQGFDGAVDVARRAVEKRQELPVDRLRLVSVPLPSRFDSQVEFKISQAWLDNFTEGLAGVYADWLPKEANNEVNRRALLEATKIPYIPYFSFGEKLAVIEQGTTDPAGLGYAYETLAAMIANNLESVEQVLDNRAEFVRAASRSEAAAPKPEAKEEVVTVETFKNEWLVAHREWLDSGGRRGRRLSLAKAVLKKINFRDAMLRKADLAEADLSEANLSYADLSEAVLTNANLRKADLLESNLCDANLSGADLRRASLPAAKLTDAKLLGAKLTEANLFRANLRGVNFEGCDLRRASLKEADLRDADLSHSKELWPNQLAGTDLTGAKLPELTLLFQGLADFNRKAWFLIARYGVMLLTCLYLVATAVSLYLSPKSSLGVSSSSDGGATVTTPSFPLLPFSFSLYRLFVIIPLLLAAFYFYFHFSLQSAWAELTSMPQVFPDGRTLDRKIQPSFVASIARLYMRREGSDPPPPSVRIQQLLTAFSVWYAVPLTFASLLSLLIADTSRYAADSIFRYAETDSIAVCNVFLFSSAIILTVAAVMFQRSARKALQPDPL